MDTVKVHQFIGSEADPSQRTCFTAKKTKILINLADYDIVFGASGCPKGQIMIGAGKSNCDNRYYLIDLQFSEKEECDSALKRSASDLLLKIWNKDNSNVTWHSANECGPKHIEGRIRQQWKRHSASLF